MSSCICDVLINPIDLNTKFVILMHPKEFKKTKNGTGFMTKNSIKNCELFIGIDFSEHNRVNELINNKNYEPYLLYPGNDSICINTQTLSKEKNKLIFIIDSTWACSKKVLKLNKNLHALKKISFKHDKTSNFRIKTQPSIECLSTIESTLCLIEELDKQNIEMIQKNDLNNFLNPFTKMVDDQLNYINSDFSKARFK
jgi:DTW domain-containing protein YfiP